MGGNWNIDIVKRTRIAIVGAGISGLVSACALQKHGFRPQVFEKAKQLGEVGAGLTLAPNATHALFSIGLEEDLMRLSTQPSEAGVRHWQTGELKVSMPRGKDMEERYGAPYLHIHRADLHDLLVQRVLAKEFFVIDLGPITRLAAGLNK